MVDCRECRFSTDKEAGTLICQRYPNAVKVGRTYWCGEFVEEKVIAKVKTQDIPALSLKGNKNEK
ncbi:hypothetical protein UFOVP155_66 [uncultured Caudovirales phage]|uniref:Uncharacterized protein n=1 Tax=uncultured Caudovirales phage TaxID=2100421 RepID=A0A6J7W9Y9_9CAUD|nr:hypothetical protein UFOVP155_66 [uncultured Caudovirales phage]